MLLNIHLGFANYSPYTICKYLFTHKFQDGYIDMLSSDHSPSAPELKLFDRGDFLRAWGGISSLQVGFASHLKAQLVKNGYHGI